MFWISYWFSLWRIVRFYFIYYFIIYSLCWKCYIASISIRNKVWTKAFTSTSCTICTSSTTRRIITWSTFSFTSSFSRLSIFRSSWFWLFFNWFSIFTWNITFYLFLFRFLFYFLFLWLFFFWFFFNFWFWWFRTLFFSFLCVATKAIGTTWFLGSSFTIWVVWIIPKPNNIIKWSTRDIKIYFFIVPPIHRKLIPNYPHHFLLF